MILVTSGAIAAGYPLLGYHERPTSVPANRRQRQSVRGFRWRSIRAIYPKRE